MTRSRIQSAPPDEGAARVAEALGPLARVIKMLGRVTRNAHLWLPGLVKDRLLRLREPAPRTLWLTIADHYEPLWRGADPATAAARVDVWRRGWPQIASRHQDASGRSPCYGFFYPQEEYRPELLEPLAEMTRSGIADVEVHIHHDRDGRESFVERMSNFLAVLRDRHGLLREQAGSVRFGFIHGNWALDNARPDGRWCGLNDELTILRDLGCYADFTLPCAPDPCQAGPVNVIYRVKDDPLRPRSHARGVRVRPGTPAWGDLTLIPGPLGLSWNRRPAWKPRLETGELSNTAPPAPARAQSWLRLAPRIGDHAFLKLFTHGAQEQNARLLLGGGLDEVFDALSRECRANGTTLLFASAWEIWGVVESLRNDGVA